MTLPAGAIRIEHVSRRFRVHDKATRTVKDLVVSLGRDGGRDVQALTDVSFAVAPGEAVALVGRNGSGKSTLLRIVSGIIKPTTGRVEVGGRVGSLLELGAGFHPEFTGRENVYLNGSIHGLARRTIDQAMDEIVAFAELERFIDLPVRTYSSGMVMRLGFAVAAHIEADVLLLDEVFAVGDEEFQRKCFRKVAEFKQRGGTIVFVSHDAAAVERLCERAVLLRQGEVVVDGPAQQALQVYHRQLAAERNPEEAAAGLREWGSGEAHIRSVRVLGPGGEERRAFLAGEPAVVEVTVEAEQALPAPWLSYELHDETGQLLAAGGEDTARLGWREEPGERLLRLALERIPVADGTFRLRFGLAAGEGGSWYHLLDDAVEFVVHPASEGKGALRLEGSWSMQEIAAGGGNHSR
jgi:ABC-type polysaccharide/polyol phosphate transport system ATPase subunit